MKKKHKNTHRQKEVKKEQHITKVKKNINISGRIILPLILFVTILAYFPSFNNDFVNWDDDWYVIENEQIRSLDFGNIIDIYSSFFHGQYSLVTTTLLALNYKIDELNPLPFHITAVLIHLINIIIVFLLTKKLHKLLHKKEKNPYQIIIPSVTALLFAINSLQVETVAWVSALKVSFFSLFFLLAIYSYLQYFETKKISKFILSMLFFMLSFGAKEQAMILPVVFIAFDFYLERPLLSRKVITEKIPFFVLAIVFGIVSLLSQKNYGAISDQQWYPFIDRIAYASYGFAIYLWKIIFPYNLVKHLFGRRATSLYFLCLNTH